MIETYLENNRDLYRTLFLEAKKSFFQKINTIKLKYTCQQTGLCCTLKYLDLTLEKINQKAETDVTFQVFKSIFKPHGYDTTYDYTDPIDLQKNHTSAESISPTFVNTVKSLHPEQIFYSCKFYINNACSVYEDRPSICRNYPNTTTVLHSGCGYQGFQGDIIREIKETISKEILVELKKIEAYRQNNFSCQQTGVCCKLSSSQNNYETLIAKAEAGDSFAKQFTSVFIPYNNLEEAKSVYPDYVEYVINSMQGEEIYFYHCPHVTEDNLCGLYNDPRRPQICKDYPNNPLTLLYHKCGYKKWKDEVLVAAMLSHAMIEICTYALDKLENVDNVENKTWH